MSKGFAPSVASAPSATAQKLRQSFIERFEALEDPRVKRQPEHLLVDIVAIAILAVLSGANDMVAVATYGKAKQSWLETFLALPNGIPSHDTFSRVLALVDHERNHHHCRN
ncbi:ISAs1 family transposase [Halomicronema hongdechloris C2206]|uniref:ISAs1 family transposase n=1 Tax=Halomicronema hongdechloris C2206 TaxID=1641165 RepID=A0A1Z3HTE4_9CYAN|nr:ISAs1 family transposase [Halomicronema hongdechloris C2206]